MGKNKKSYFKFNFRGLDVLSNLSPARFHPEKGARFIKKTETFNADLKSCFKPVCSACELPALTVTALTNCSLQLLLPTTRARFVFLINLSTVLYTHTHICIQTSKAGHAHRAEQRRRNLKLLTRLQPHRNRKYSFQSAKRRPWLQSYI